MNKLDHRIIWIPLFLLIAIASVSIINGQALINVLTNIQSWVLRYFDWLFNYTVFVIVILLIVVYFSPLGKLKIGGEDAIPMLSKPKWFSILLCSTIATGILFWACAEPLFHIHQPPEDLISPLGEDAKVTAMSSMFMHWTISPYAIYTLLSLVFAIVYYNYKSPFRVSAILIPLSRNSVNGILGNAIDSICLFVLVAGMSANLGAGVLTISGGLNSLLGLMENSSLWALIAMSVVIGFTISAATGLKRGITYLSILNVAVFVVMILLFLFFLSDSESLILAGKGAVEYIITFVPRSLSIGGFDRSWEQSWTVFYWANWMAWAPVTALFLGRIGYGYRVRTFIIYNLVLPSLFSIVWMSVFSAVAIEKDFLLNGQLYAELQYAGPQSVMYALLEMLPGASFFIPLFVAVVYLSFVTAADSNTSAMGGLSTKGVNSENPESPLLIKVIWGTCMAIVAWAMISFAGIEGIKTISVIGGFPALFVCIVALMALAKMVYKKPEPLP